jgi:hypothetical protein
VEEDRIAMPAHPGTPDTFPKLLLLHAQVRGALPAIREKDLGIWQSWTWGQVRDEVHWLACGLAQAGLARIATDLDDAARAAGTRPSGLIRSIHLPLLRPALWGTALLVFVDCMKELPATLLLRPLNVETLSTYIYQFATRGNFEDGALAALLIVLVGIAPVIWMIRHAEDPLPGAPGPDPKPDT